MSELFDYFLTAQELGEVLGVTAQAVHKFCRENGIEKKGTNKSDRIYPAQVREITDMRQIPRVKKKVAIHTVKGGAGKTTIAHGVGTRASSYGFKTLLIDLDKQANLTMSLALHPKKDDFCNFMDLYTAERDGEDIDYSDYIVELTPFLHLLPANLKLANLDLLLQLNSSNIGNIIPTLLGDLEDEYDLILFDLSCDFNRVTMAVHSYVDTCIIPTDPDTFGLFGVELTYDHVSQVEKEWKNSPQKLVILNKFNASHTSAYELIADLKSKYNDDVFESIISTSKPMADAIKKNKSIWAMSRKKLTALEGLDSITKKILVIDQWASAKKRTKSSSVVNNLGEEAVGR